MKGDCSIIEKARAIRAGCIDETCERNTDMMPFDAACLALALLTSAVKAEREEGKAMVRSWRRGKVSHAKPDGVE